MNRPNKLHCLPAMPSSVLCNTLAFWAIRKLWINEVSWIQSLGTYWQHSIFFVSYDCPNRLHCLSLVSHSILSVMKHSSLLGHSQVTKKMKCREYGPWDSYTKAWKEVNFLLTVYIFECLQDDCTFIDFLNIFQALNRSIFGQLSSRCWGSFYKTFYRVNWCQCIAC